MKPIEFHIDAVEELWKATKWYDGQRIGLGDEFLVEYGKAEDRIQNHPLSFADERGDGIRYCPFDRFPFAIVYLIEPTRIWVVAIADQRRRPRYWSRRL